MGISIKAITGSFLLISLLSACGGGGGQTSQSGSITSTTVTNASTQTSTNGYNDVKSTAVTTDLIIASEPASVSFPLDLYNAQKQVITILTASKASNVLSANMTLSAFDADFPSEGELSINGNDPIILFGNAASNANDQQVKDITISTPANYWIDGKNTLVFTHLDTVGFRIENVTVAFSSLPLPVPGPIATFSSSSFEFGNQNVGGISAPQALTITNTSTADIFISDISITNNFIEGNNCGNYLPIGGTCSIDLTFLPSGSGNLLGTLVISDNTADSPHSIQLSGTSVDSSNSTALYLDDDFEASDWAEKYNVLNNITREGGVAARSGSFGLRIHVDNGEHWGGRLLFDHSKHDQNGNFTEVWTRYYVQYGPNWGSEDGRLGKAGYRARSDEVCGAPCLEMTDSHEVDSSGAIAGYSYFHKKVSDSSIEAKTFEYGRDNWSTAGLRARERWYCVETHHVLNTPGQSDGVYQNWVDGTLVSDQNDIHQRDTATVDIDSSALIAYIGGSWTSDRDMDIYFDDWAVSSERIGCI